MQWFIGNLQNTFSLITKVSKVDTDQNVWEVQSAISGPKCPKQQWRQFLSKENVSPGILYQEEKCGFNFYVHHFPSSRSGYFFLLDDNHFEKLSSNSKHYLCKI